MNLTLIKEMIEQSELNSKLFETKTALEIKLNLIKEAIRLEEYQINTDSIAYRFIEDMPMFSLFESA